MKWSADPKKAASNLKKHGIRFEDAVGVFDDPFAQAEPNAGGPGRWSIIGHPPAMREVVYVVYIERGVDEDGEEWIHLISAREATNRERQEYEESF